ARLPPCASPPSRALRRAGGPGLARGRGAPAAAPRLHDRPGGLRAPASDDGDRRRRRGLLRLAEPASLEAVLSVPPAGVGGDRALARLQLPLVAGAHGRPLAALAPHHVGGGLRGSASRRRSCVEDRRLRARRLHGGGAEVRPTRAEAGPRVTQSPRGVT